MQTFSKKNLSLMVLIVFISIPIFRWFFIEPLSFRFFDLNSTTTSIGQIFGILGIMLFSINLILSNRSHFFDRIFSGLHNFYNIHRYIGTISFSLILFHPIFLVVKYLSVSLKDAALFLLPRSNFPITLGIIALVLMIVLLVLTLHLKIKYNLWRYSHKAMIVVFFFILGHTLLISSDISRDVFLRFYVLIFAIIGFASGFYRSFLRIFFNKDFECKVTSLNSVADNILEIEFEPKDNINFYPGQFVFVRFVGNGTSSEPHPFSISSSSSEKKFKLVIKALGDFTSDLKNINVGTLAKIEGPFGEFFKKENYLSDTGREIWVAGGIGITPFLSMARSLGNTNRQIDLFYSFKDKKEGVFLDELKGIGNINKKFRFFPWLSVEKKISASKIKESIGEFGIDTEVYICGPLPFMLDLKNQFVDIGIDKNNINFEKFNFL